MMKKEKKQKLKLHNLTVLTPTKKCKRLGRGTGSGHGKTSTAGHKGQRSRSGHKIGIAFEGGQMPFYRRIPKKRGFSSVSKVAYQVVNLYQIDKLKLKTVNHQTLFVGKLISSLKKPIKVLGDGNLTFTAHFQVNALSKTAISKVKSVQGKIDLI